LTGELLNDNPLGTATQEWEEGLEPLQPANSGSPVKKLRVRNLTKDTILADRALIADTAQKRNTGLLKHTGLEPGEGLWIVPTEGVHTFGMKFTIDVLFLDKKRKVVKVRANMVKRRIALSLRANSVLELPAGRAAEMRTEVGDQLEFEKYDA
jgi:uncharacterized membrane protein (UPF0127 family)